MLLAFATPAALAAPAAPDPVAHWNTQLLAAVRAANLAPPAVSRELAILNVAMFEAVNAATGLQYTPYRATALAPGADPRAVADAAGRTVLNALHPGKPMIEPSGLGRRIALDLLAERQDDGAALVVPPYLGGDAPNKWRPTPPATAPGVLSQWPGVAPWVITALLPYHPPGPPAPGSVAWLESLQTTESLGSADSKQRTADQTEAALFWADGDGTAGPPGHWISIAVEVARANNLDLLASSRLLALISMAEADAAIVAWDAKYHYALWRPVTAIHAQGNRIWTPLLKNPSFPEYVSGHSLFSAAGAELLCLYFGTDKLAFSITSDARELPGTVHQYESFSEAVTEAGASRIWGGLHYPFSDRDGQVAGRAVADSVFTHALLPIGQPPPVAACRRP